MTTKNQNPEQIARDQIDFKLVEAGWCVQNKDALDFNAGQGVAVREYQTDAGPADYVLFVDRRAVGVIEAKPKDWGHKITTVEEQSAGYAAAKLKWVSNNEPLPYIYESTGIITRFTDGRDPRPRSREVFTFHRPETMADWLSKPKSLRARLHDIPALNHSGLRDCQISAVEKLEKSFREDRPRALVQMATGSGKTFTAITSAYRLLKYADAKRILFLVDTKNLGEQAEQEFMSYLPNDDNRKFTELYNVQRLKLTAEWRAKHPDRETGAALRQRVLKTRRDEWAKAEKARLKEQGHLPSNDHWRARYPEPEGFDSEELPALPDEWCWVGLDELVSGKPRSMQSGPFGSNLRHSEFQASGVLVLGIDNVRDGTFSMGSQNRISEQKFQDLEKYQARPGDLLVTVMASLGRTCIVPRDLERAIITKHVYRISMEEQLLFPEYFNLLLQSQTVSRLRMFKSAQGQTRPGLNSSILKALPIPLCSRKEQVELVSRLSSQLSDVDSMISQIDDEFSRATALRQSILKRAFSGQLVAQDSNDEPASVLLERIRAEKEDGGNGRKKNIKNNGKKEAA